MRRARASAREPRGRSRRSARRSPCQVQTGGGVRSVEAAGRAARAGVARVVSALPRSSIPSWWTSCACCHPGRVAVGLDARGARGRDPRVGRGDRRSTSSMLARRFDAPGVGALVVTSIGHDGTIDGPDLEQLALVLAATSVPVIASGGVGDARRPPRARGASSVGGRRLRGGDRRQGDLRAPLHRRRGAGGRPAA